MKAKTKQLLKMIRQAKYHAAYKYYVKHNITKYGDNVDWYANDWAKAFCSIPVNENYPSRKEVYH